MDTTWLDKHWLLEKGRRSSQTNSREMWGNVIFLLNFCKRFFSHLSKVQDGNWIQDQAMMEKNEFSRMQQSWHWISSVGNSILSLSFGVFDKHTLFKIIWKDLIWTDGRMTCYYSWLSWITSTLPQVFKSLDRVKVGSCVPTLRVTPSFKGHTNLSFKKGVLFATNIQPTDPLKKYWKAEF